MTKTKKRRAEEMWATLPQWARADILILFRIVANRYKQRSLLRAYCALHPSLNKELLQLMFNFMQQVSKQEDDFLLELERDIEWRNHSIEEEFAKKIWRKTVPRGRSARKAAYEDILVWMADQMACLKDMPDVAKLEKKRS